VVLSSEQARFLMNFFPSSERLYSVTVILFFKNSSVFRVENIVQKDS